MKSVCWPTAVVFQNQKKRRQWADVVEKLREVSDIVWVCLKGMIEENTLQEEWTDKK